MKEIKKKSGEVGMIPTKEPSLPKEVSARKPRKQWTTKQKCECGGNLMFRKHGLVDFEGVWHSDYPDWYRCEICGQWTLAYTDTEGNL